MPRTHWLEVFVLTTLFCGSFASAQTVEATLSGTITDPSGAAIVGAQVTATESSQGVVRSTKTNEAGLYNIPNLQPGRYQVAVQASGFKAEVMDGVGLQVQQSARLDFHLTLGAVTESVQVAGNAVALHTDDSVVGQVISNKSIVELPLNGRNYLELAQLTAGVSPASGSRTSDSGSFSALGQHGYQTRVVLDGVDNSSSGSGGQIGREAQAVKPSIDAVQEFKVVTNNNSAEYGLRMGGTVIVSTKAGTNQYHGSLFEFLRNDVMDASNYFAVGQPKPPFRQNEFGGTFGGPVIRNRTFFFAAFDGTRTRESLATISTVPLPAELTGNFTGQTPVYDPLTSMKNAAGKVARTQFPNNVIPTSRFDPIAAKLVSLYPAPNLGGIANNYYYPGSYADNPNEIDTRLDQVINEKNRAFVRYSRRWDDQANPGPMPLPADGAAWTTLALQADSLAANLNTTLTPSINNDLRLGYSRLNTDLGIPATENLNSKYGINGLGNYGEYNQTGLASMVINGFNSLGSKTSNPNKNNMSIYQISDDLLTVRGRHTIKFGFSGLREGIFRKTAKNSRGQLTFDGSYTNDPAVTGASGLGIADFILGDAQKMQYSNLAGETIVTHNYSSYVQDDWRVNSRLTLNIGLRWDFFGRPSYGNAVVSAFQFVSGSQNYQIVYPQGHGDCGCDNAMKNFAPRAGLAYQLRPTTVIRSGFGTFYGMADGIQDTSGAFFNEAPNYDAISVTGDKYTKPAAVLGAGFPAGVIDTTTVPANVSVNESYRYLPVQYSMQWFFDVQQQLGQDGVLTLSYLGSGTRHISQSINVNQPPPGPGSVASRSPYPNFAAISVNAAIANANYNGFTAKYEKRYAHGFLVLGSYTWSHAIDNAVENLNGSLGQDPQNYLNMANQRGNSIFDVRHRFVTSVVYDLPFGQGKRFLNRKGVTDSVLGGWQVAGIVNLYTGSPFAPIVSTDQQNTGTTNRPNRIADGALPSDQQSIYRWFNLSAFQIPALYTYGNAGRNILYGPGTRNLNVKFGKNFLFAERWRLEFRAEMFNAFNTPNFGVPNPNVDLPQGGQITTVKNARQVQLGLKLGF